MDNSSYTCDNTSTYNVSCQEQCQKHREEPYQNNFSESEEGIRTIHVTESESSFSEDTDRDPTTDTEDEDENEDQYPHLYAIAVGEWKGHSPTPAQRQAIEDTLNSFPSTFDKTPFDKKFENTFPSTFETPFEKTPFEKTPFEKNTPESPVRNETNVMDTSAVKSFGELDWNKIAHESQNEEDHFNWNRWTIMSCLREEFELNDEVKSLVLELADEHRQTRETNEEHSEGHCQSEDCSENQCQLDDTKTPVPDENEVAEETSPTEGNQDRSDRSGRLVQGFTELLGVLLTAQDTSDFETKMMGKAKEFCGNLLPESQRPIVNMVFDSLGQLMKPSRNSSGSDNSSSFGGFQQQPVAQNSHPTGPHEFATGDIEQGLTCSVLDNGDVAVNMDCQTNENTHVSSNGAISFCVGKEGEGITVEHQNHGFRKGDVLSWGETYCKILEIKNPNKYRMDFVDSCSRHVSNSPVKRWYPHELLEVYDAKFLDSLEHHWEYYANKFLNHGAEIGNEQFCNWLLLNFDGFDYEVDPTWDNGNEETETAFDYMIMNKLQYPIQLCIWNNKVGHITGWELDLALESNCPPNIIRLLLERVVNQGYPIDWTDSVAKAVLTERKYWDILTPGFLVTLPEKHKQMAFEFLQQQVTKKYK